MNWAEVNAFVEDWAARRGLPADMTGMALVLVDFEDAADCEYFHPGRDEISQRAFTMALAKLARGRHARTEHATIRREHYRAWLAAENAEDTAGNRERFIESRYRVVPGI